MHGDAALHHGGADRSPGNACIVLPGFSDVAVDYIFPLGAQCLTFFDLIQAYLEEVVSVIHVVPNYEAFRCSLCCLATTSSSSTYCTFSMIRSGTDYSNLVPTCSAATKLPEQPQGYKPFVRSR